MLIIPLIATPSQTVKIILENQICQLNIYQKFYGVFFDLLVDGDLIIGGQICQNLNRIVRSVYLGFTGDFMFIDNEGSSDPIYSGLGSRYSLAYLEPVDLEALGFAA